MSMPSGVVRLSQEAVAKLVILQSALTGLQVIAAASVLGDVLGDKYAALFIVVIAGAQQAVNTFISKTAAETAVHVEAALSRVDDAVTHAETATANAESATAQVEATQSRKGGRYG